MRRTERTAVEEPLEGLAEPWGWLDPQSSGSGEPLVAGLGPVLLAPADEAPYRSPDPCELPRRGPAFCASSGTFLRAYDFPRAEEAANSGYKIRSRTTTLPVEIREQCPRPAHASEDIQLRSEQIENLVDSMVGVMLELRSITEYVAGLSELHHESLSENDVTPAEGEFSSASPTLLRMNWEEVADCLFAASDEPRMDLIVRIARQYERELRELAGKPRHVLQRVRRKQSLGRVQEIDSTCLRWLVRQPGRTPTQKAGPEQEMLAVTRTQDYDTLENRVLKDFLVRSRRAAELYARKNRASYAESYRCRLVGRFRDLCIWLLRQTELQEVQTLRRVPQPNYALQHDRSYRRLWQWYMKLVRRERQNDEAWRWQGRLWGDIIRLLTTASLLSFEESGYSTRSAFRHDLWVREEQDDGSWLLPIDWPGPITVRRPDGKAATAQCLHPRALKRGLSYQGIPVADWVGRTGSDLGVLFSPLSDASGPSVCVFIWGIHSAGERMDDPRVLDQCSRAHRALRQLKQGAKPENVVVKGLILRSSPGGDSFDLPSAGSPGGTEVVGLAVPCDPGEWRSSGGVLDVLSVFWCECADLVGA